MEEYGFKYDIKEDIETLKSIYKASFKQEFISYHLIQNIINNPSTVSELLKDKSLLFKIKTIY